MFVFNLFVSTISNYQLYSFILKSIATVLLWSFIIYDKSRYNKDIKIFRFKNKELLLFLGVTVYFLLTLSYSQNPAFGLKKIIYLVICTIPVVIACSYLVQRISFDTFRKSVLPVGVITGLYVVLIYPFNQFSGYEFEIGRWSHVIYGRFLFLMFLITLISVYESKSKTHIIIYSILTFFFVYITFLSGLRAAIIGIAAITFLSLLLYRSNKKLIVFASVFIGFVLSFSIQQVSSNPTKRLENLTKQNFDNDASITTRLGVYQIAVERFFEYPLLGVGIGGFNKEYEGNKLPAALKYPHNIFLEFASEFGIIGLALFLILLYWMLRETYKIHIGLFLYVILALWLAQFSKDIPTNTMVWVVIGIYADDHT